MTTSSTCLVGGAAGSSAPSHAYVDARAAATTTRSRQGLLGADLSRYGRRLLAHRPILPSGDVRPPAARSPLAAPGVAVRAGDAILAVDGQEVDP